MKVLALAIVVVFLACCGCSETHPSELRDYESLVPETYEPRMWKCSRMELGSSGFVASAGSVIIEDRSAGVEDYYSIGIELTRPGGASVYFSRDLPMGMIPESVRRKDVKRLVVYIANTRTVRFDLRNHSYAYVLPSPSQL